MKAQLDLAKERVGKLVIAFSLPAIAMMVLGALYNAADRIFVGQALGTPGIAAVTAAFPLMMVSVALGCLFGGAGTMITLRMGAGKPEEAARFLSKGFWLSLGVSIVTLVPLYVFLRPILTVFGATEALMADALDYSRIVLVGFVFQIPAMAVGGSLRAQGRPGWAMAPSVVGTVLNIGLDALFIFGFGWGVAGAAWATTLSQALTLALTLSFIQHRRSVLRLSTRTFRTGPGFTGQILGQGLPIFLVQFVSVFVFVAANASLSRIGGETGLAAVGIINTACSFLAFPLVGVLQGAMTVWGYAFGAKQPDRIRETTRIAFVGAALFGVLGTVVSLALPGVVIRLFNTQDPLLMEVGIRGMSIFMAGFFLYSVEALAAHYFIAVGKPKQAGVVLLGRSALMAVLFLVLPRFFGVDGAFLAGPGTDVVVAVLAGVLIVRENRYLKRGTGNTELHTIEAVLMDAE